MQTLIGLEYNSSFFDLQTPQLEEYRPFGVESKRLEPGHFGRRSNCLIAIRICQLQMILK